MFFSSISLISSECPVLRQFPGSTVAIREISGKYRAFFLDGANFCSVKMTQEQASMPANLCIGHRGIIQRYLSQWQVLFHAMLYLARGIPEAPLQSPWMTIVIL
jgi:hypothetical protein